MAWRAHGSEKLPQRTHIFETKASFSKLGYAEVMSVRPAGTRTLKKLSPGVKTASTCQREAVPMTTVARQAMARLRQKLRRSHGFVQQRIGDLDALARYARVSSRALAPVAGAANEHIILRKAHQNGSRTT